MGFVELDKSLLEAKAQLGELLLETQKYVEAETLYTSLLQDARDVRSTVLEARSHFGLGLMYRYQRQWVNAERELNRAIELAGADEKLVADATFSLGVVAFEQKQWETAVTQFTTVAVLYKLLEEVRASADAYYHLGRVYEELDMWDDALTNLQTAQERLDDVFVPERVSDLALQLAVQRELARVRLQIGTKP